MDIADRRDGARRHRGGLASLSRPAILLVPVFGRFGHLKMEIGRRLGAEVVAVETEWGRVFDPEEIEAAIKRQRPRMVAISHGDTSTTMLQPLAEIGALCRKHDVLLYVDCTASLGGNAFGWTPGRSTWHRPVAEMPVGSAGFSPGQLQ